MRKTRQKKEERFKVVNRRRHDSYRQPPMIPGVELRPVVGYPDYLVGDDGSVWTSRRSGSGWKKLKPSEVRGKYVNNTDGANGYLIVSLARYGVNSVADLKLVHRLVLEAFVGPCPEGMECCHFPDKNPWNNRLSNLRWGTKAENAADRSKHRQLEGGSAT